MCQHPRHPRSRRGGRVTLTVIFDLDGTLVDSVADIHAAIALLLQGEGLPPLDRATVQSFVGNGLPKLVRTGDGRLRPADGAACGTDRARLRHLHTRPPLP